MYEKYILQTEADRCLLCMNAPCTSACPGGFDPAKFMRSVRFKNPAAGLIDTKICKGCGGFCENACVLPESKIRIRRAAECAENAEKMKIDETARILYTKIASFVGGRALPKTVGG